MLIACDGDFIPLVRKLNTLGTRVMLLGWDYSYVDADGKERKTVTSVRLLDEVTHPILMNGLIDDKTRQHDSVVNNLFLPRKEEQRSSSPAGNPSAAKTVSSPAASSAEGTLEDAPSDFEDKATQRGRIQNLKAGYGFIAPENGGRNLFFYWSDIRNKDFNDLSIGDGVEFVLGSNDKGPAAKEIVVTAPAYRQVAEE